MDQSNRLVADGLTIREFLKLCYKYNSREDNKAKRAKMDIVSAKLTKRQNYQYNGITREWEQTGRDAKLEFLVKSDPVSYKKTDSIPIHRYPVTFVIHDIDAGLDTTFRYRSGSLMKPVFSKVKGDSKQIAERNIRNRVDLSFFFIFMYVYRKFNILYGRNWATRPPLKTNPKMMIGIDKHGWYCLTKILLRLLTDKKQLLKDTVAKNEEKGVTEK